MNILTIAMALMAAPPDADAVARSLDEVARIATVMVDGDLCRRIVTPRAIAAMLKEDPRDRWAGADNYDVDHAAYIQTKKVLARLGRLAPFPCDVNLWMPLASTPPRIHVVIRNAHEISQFWPWGTLHQPMIPEMKQVLDTGRRVTVRQKGGLVSVLAPVYDSLGDIAGVLEVVASGTQNVPVPHF